MANNIVAGQRVEYLRDELGFLGSHYEVDVDWVAPGLNWCCVTFTRNRGDVGVSITKIVSLDSIRPLPYQINTLVDVSLRLNDEEQSGYFPGRIVDANHSEDNESEYFVQLDDFPQIVPCSRTDLRFRHVFQDSILVHVPPPPPPQAQ